MGRKAVFAEVEQLSAAAAPFSVPAVSAMTAFVCALVASLESPELRQLLSPESAASGLDPSPGPASIASGFGQAACLARH